MLSKTKILWGLFLIVVLSQPIFLISLASAQTTTINNREFKKIGGKWYQLDGDVLYKVVGKVITVKFKPDITAAGIDALNSINGTIIKRYNRLGYYDLEIVDTKDPLDLVQQYMASGLVDVVEPNTYGKYHGDSNDPFFNNQRNLKQSNDADIDAPEGWDIEAGRNTVIMSVIDSGVDIVHEDLAGNMWKNYDDPVNGVDDDANGYIDDYDGWDFDND